MKALVTGGGGFLGSAIVRLLRERGDEVVSFSRSRYASLDSLGVMQVQGDLGDLAAVESTLQECDIVFHVAAKAGVWGRWEDYFTANVTGTRNILEACKRRGIQRLVYTSSPSVTFAGTDQKGVDESEPYPTHFLAHYPHTKAIAEQEVLAANGPTLATVALRPHLIWGPGDPHLVPRLLERARAGKLKRIGSGQKVVDTVFVENAAAAHLQAADKLAIGSPVAGKAYFLSQDEPTPLFDFINQILSLAKLAPVTKSVPASVAYLAGAILEKVYRLKGEYQKEPPMTRFVARQLSTDHWFDLTAAKTDFGYAPAISTRKGLERLHGWIEEQGSR
jgi:nucleoside-diphosphate-sugar epimerase